MATYELERRETDEGNVVLVEVAGELDLTNARAFEEQLEELAAGDPILVLDLNRLVFLDSAAVHVLFRIARRLGEKRLGIVLDSNAAVARTLAIVGLHLVGAVHATAEAVLAELAPQKP